MNHELDHHPKHMVLQNLSKIKKCVERMMEIATNDPKAEDLILNHAWMVDHIATSADDLQEACDFMCYRLGEDNTTRIESVQLVQAASDAFESNKFRASNFDSFVLESDRMSRKRPDIYDRFLDDPQNPRGRAKAIISKFLKQYGEGASQMAVDRFAEQNNLTPEEKYILKYITRNDIRISSQPGGPNYSALR